MLLLITHKGRINLLKELIFRINLVLDIDKSVIPECPPVTFLQVKVFLPDSTFTSVLNIRPNTYNNLN